MSNSLLKDGTFTGFMDSHGQQIKIGSIVRVPNEVNHDFHGEYEDFLVKAVGVIPVLCYLESQTGKKLPEGYLACVLSDKYDEKLLLFANDSTDLRPMADIKVITR